MLYKAQLSDTIIDVFDCLNYCKYVPRSRAVLRCGAKNAPEGIISERTGRYYHVDGWPEFPDVVQDSGGTIILSEIDQTTYDQMLEALNDGEVPEDGSLHEEVDDPNDEPETPTKTTAQKLKEENEELRKRIDFLTECLLEMSEAVYAG